MHSFSNLRVFCEHIVRKHGEPTGVSEEQLAEDFRTVYLKGLPLNLSTLRAAAASCGIRLRELEKMPENVRGYHEVYGDNKNIYFRKGDALSGIQNTILHETREMMEILFTEVQPDYMPLRTSARHIAANRFADGWSQAGDGFGSRYRPPISTTNTVKTGKPVFSGSISQYLHQQSKKPYFPRFYAIFYELIE
jgi:hypothetical protein